MDNVVEWVLLILAINAFWFALFMCLLYGMRRDFRKRMRGALKEWERL